MKIFIGIFTFFFFAFSFAFSTYAREDCSLNLQQEDLNQYRYIVVPGFFNEFIAHYMTEYRRFLMSEGVPSNQIHRFNSSSLSQPDFSVATLKGFVEDLPKDKKFVFFAHSKGALESLYFLKKHHKSIPFEKAILIQGPLDGASMTKTPNQEGFPIFFKKLLEITETEEIIKNFNRSFGSTYVRKRLGDLHSDSELLNKTLFVATETTYDRLKFKLRFMGGLYRESFGSVGDGILLKSDQMPYVLKEDKGVCRWDYRLDHADLVKAAPWQNSKRQIIQKFLRRILFGSKRNK